jgi:HlyD family secretion protein
LRTAVASNRATCWRGSNQAKAVAVAAEDAVTIVASQNESDLEAAKVAIELAELNVRKYVEGDYPQLLKGILARKRVAEADLEALREQADAVERRVKAGRMTADEARGWRSRLLAAEVALDMVKEEQRVLEQFGLTTMRRDLESKLAEARRTPERVRTEAKAKAAHAAADRAAKREVLAQEEARYREIEGAIGHCQIIAPRDGTVFYHVSDQGRWGGAAGPVVAVGEPVREGQKLMRIPDLSRMVVTVRVPEAVITRVRAGQAAVVRIDAFPGREFRGTVRQVAAVPSRQDWLMADMKTYPVQVALDGTAEGLRPGMSADVTLITGEELADALAVPVQAVLPPTAAGQRLCVVRTPAGLEQREVTLGPGNGKMTAVRSGLAEGETVILNPRAHYAEPSDRRRP